MKKSNIVRVEIRTHKTDIIDSLRVYVTYESGATRTYKEINKTVLAFIIGNLNVSVFSEISETSENITTIFYANEINANDVIFEICRMINNARSVFTDGTCHRTICIGGIKYSLNDFLSVTPARYLANHYMVNVVYDNHSNSAFCYTFTTIQNAYNAKNELLERWGY